MANYNVRMPTGHQGRYKVRMPTGHVGSYKVRLPDTVPETEAITIDMTGAPTGASWTLWDSGAAVDTGTTSQGPTQYPFETYTLVWEDTAFAWIPPADEGPTVLSAGNPITFGPP